MTFLSGQDDFFQTANQPISVRHLSEPYNKRYYLLAGIFSKWPPMRVVLMYYTFAKISKWRKIALI